MTIVFRVDASMVIGSGHVMRCLTLARWLKRKGARVVFVIRDLPGHLAGLVRRAGIPVELLPSPNREVIEPLTAHSHWLGVHWEKDARETALALSEYKPVDWLAVDHYAIEKHWEILLRPCARHFLVLDDLADREHECDLLLDQNYLTDFSVRYRGLLPLSCRTFLGPRYALLRDEFFRERENLRRRTGTIERILVFYGGYDQGNATGVALRSVLALQRKNITVDVVVGEANPHYREIEAFCSRNESFFYHRQVNNMAELMNRSDLALGAGGATMWERCFLGLPSLVTILAENQRNTALSSALYGAGENMGEFAPDSGKRLTQKLHELIDHPAELLLMSHRALELSGEGVGPPGQGFKESLWTTGG